MIVFVSCMFFLLHSCGSLMINQHSCVFKKNMLLCKFEGEGIYETDRVLPPVERVQFEIFGKGRIFIHDGHLPNLKELVVEKSESSTDLCQNIICGDGVEVMVEGSLCKVEKLEYSSTESSSLTDITSAKWTVSVVAEMSTGRFKTKTEKEDKYPETNFVLIVAVVVLTMILVVVSVVWIKYRIRCEMINREYHLSRRAFSERMRQMRSQQNEDTPV